MSEELKKLFKAIKNKEKDVVRGMLEKNSSLIDYTDLDGWGAIHVCASEGNKEIMKILIEEFKADIDQHTEYRYTPIHIAAKSDNIDCLIELIKHGADTRLMSRGCTDVIDFLTQSHPKIGDLVGFTPNLHLELQDDHLKLIGNNGSPEYDISSILAN